MDIKLLNRLTSNSSKRILSLDGGGIRGALSLGYLKKIETILREKENNHNYVLSDYFDLIGGTSAPSHEIGVERKSIRKKGKPLLEGVENVSYLPSVCTNIRPH